MVDIKINTAQFSGGAYTAGNSSNDFNKSLVNNQTGQDIGSGINTSDFQALANSFDAIDGATGGFKDNLINTDDLGRAVESGKLDPAAQKAAILLMTNPNLLNKLDDGAKDGLISKESLTNVVPQNDASNKFTNAVKDFSTNTHVLDNFEQNGMKNNDRFGTAAVAQLANAKPEDRTWDDTGLGGVSMADRQKYIDDAKTMWGDQGHLNNLAGDDGIMLAHELGDYVKNNPTSDTINA